MSLEHLLLNPEQLPGHAIPLFGTTDPRCLHSLRGWGVGGFVWVSRNWKAGKDSATPTRSTAAHFIPSQDTKAVSEDEVVNPQPQNSIPHHCRANMAHIRESRPDIGLGFKAKVLQTIEGVPFLHGNGPQTSYLEPSTSHLDSPGKSKRRGIRRTGPHTQTLNLEL